jgi:hypothetical protein
MKRSQGIALGMMPIAAAAFLAGCNDPQRKACVDQNGVVVSDANCATAPSTGTSGSGGAHVYPIGYPYHWYWYRGGTPVVGTRAPGGGSYAAPATRGGFGSTAGRTSGS